MAVVQLPNGSYLDIPQGMTPAQAYAAAQQHFPEAFMSPEEREQKQGFFPAIAHGFREAKAATERGLGEMTGSETLRDWAAQDEADLKKNPSQVPITDADTAAAWKQGLLPGAGKAFSKYVSEPVGGIIGGYGAPMALGAAAAALAPEAGIAGLGTAAIGALGVSLSDLPAEVGRNVQEQKESGKAVDLTKATTFGLAQAALAGFGIPGVGALPKYAQKVFGKEASALAKQVAEGMPKEEALAKLTSTLGNIVQGTATNAVAGTGMMVGTEVMRGLAADKDLTSPEMQERLKQSAVGALEMAPLFGLYHGVGQRGREVKAIEGAGDVYAEKQRKEKVAADDLAAAEESERKHAAELYEKQAQTGDLFGEQFRTEGPAKGKEKFGKMEGDVSPLPGNDPFSTQHALFADQGTEDGVRQTSVSDIKPAKNERELQLQQAQEEQRIAAEQEKKQERIRANNLKYMGGVYPEGEQYWNQNLGGSRAVLADQKLDALKGPDAKSLMRQRDLLFRNENGSERGHIPELRDQMNEAAGKGDTEALMRLGVQLQQAEKAHADATKQIKELAPIEELPELKLAELNGQIRSKTEQLKKLSGAEGDFDKMHKLAKEIEDLKKRAGDVQPPDLVDTAHELKAQADAEREQQADLFYDEQDAAARSLGQKKEPYSRYGQAINAYDEMYQKKVKELEDAYAANADQRIIDRLVEEVRAASIEKAGKLATTSDIKPTDVREEQQQRVERIKRAIAEAEAKGDTASVAGLRNQLAKAIGETAEPDAATRRSHALEHQQAAIEELRSHIEDLANKRYLHGDSVINIDAQRQKMKEARTPEQYDQAVADMLASLPTGTRLLKIHGREAYVRTGTTHDGMQIVSLHFAHNDALLFTAYKNKGDAHWTYQKSKDGGGAISGWAVPADVEAHGQKIEHHDTSMASSMKSTIEQKANAAIGRYTEASVRDVNAVREQKGIKRLTNDEALRLAMDVRAHLEKALKDKNVAALDVPIGDLHLEHNQSMKPRELQSVEERSQSVVKQEGKYSPIERQLAQIKAKYHKGEPVEKFRAKETPPLRLTQLQETVHTRAQAEAKGAQERLQSLREKLEAVEHQKDADPRVVQALKNEIEKERKLAGEEERPHPLQEKLDALKKQKEPNQQAIAELEAAIKEGRGVKEEGVPTGTSPDQKGLFAENSDDSLVVARSTPEKFLAYLKSGAVQKMLQKINDGNRKAAELTAAVAKEAQLSKTRRNNAGVNVDATRGRVELLEKQLADLEKAVGEAAEMVELSRSTKRMYREDVVRMSAEMRPEEAGKLAAALAEIKRREELQPKAKQIMAAYTTLEGKAKVLREAVAAAREELRNAEATQHAATMHGTEVRTHAVSEPAAKLSARIEEHERIALHSKTAHKEHEKLSADIKTATKDVHSSQKELHAAERAVVAARAAFDKAESVRPIDDIRERVAYYESVLDAHKKNEKLLDLREQYARELAKITHDVTPENAHHIEQLTQGLRDIDKQLKEHKRKSKTPEAQDFYLATKQLLEREKDLLADAEVLEKGVSDARKAYLKKNVEHSRKMKELDAKQDSLYLFEQEKRDYLRTSVEKEKQILAELNEKLKDATTPHDEQEQVRAQIRESRDRQTALELAERQREETVSHNRSMAEQARLERQADAATQVATIKREVVRSQYQTKNKKSLNDMKKLEAQMMAEMKKASPDQKRLADIAKKLLAIEPNVDVYQKKTTHGTMEPTRAERVETDLERQAREREDALAFASKNTSTPELRAKVTELRDVQRQIEAAEKAGKEPRKLKEQEKKLQEEVNALKADAAKAREEGLPNRIPLADWHEEHSRISKDLAETREQIKKALADKTATRRLLAKEKNQIAELEALRQQGPGVERALEVLGNAPGHVTKTKVELTPEQKAKAKEVRALRAKERRQNADIEAYLDRMEKEGPDTYEDFAGEYSGTRMRIARPTETRISEADGTRAAASIEKGLPKDVKLTSVHSYEELPADVRAAVEADGVPPEVVKGMVMPNGDVYVVRGNHENALDLEKTYAHEVVGHAGVDRLLGEKGMADLSKRIGADHDGHAALAEALGVGEQVRGAMFDRELDIERMRQKGASKEEIAKAEQERDVAATRELIAYTAEQRVSEGLLKKAGRWLKELVGAIRAALRKMGLVELPKVSTSDIFHLLRQSQRNYNNGELGSFRKINGDIAFRDKKAKYKDSYDPELRGIGERVVAQQKGAVDRAKSAALCMSFMHRFTDQFAGLEYIARNMHDALRGFQMMYNNRLYNQHTQAIGEVATHGPIAYQLTRGSVKDKDAEFQYVSRKTGGLSPILENIEKSAGRIGSTEAALQQFSLYLAAERVEGLAKRDGTTIERALEKLNLNGDFTAADMKKVLAEGRADANFQTARKQYRTYNDGMIDLMTETGRLSKEQAAKLKEGDYIPFYREKNGEVWDNEYNIRVGNLKDQAYLKELVGGDKPILSFEAGALQNTHMLTEMAMRNIATKDTAYTLNQLGMAELRPGKGPARPDVIRFYDKGKEVHAILNTKDAYIAIEARLDKMREKGKANTQEYKDLRTRAEASRESASLFGGIPAELIVKGMEGTGMTVPAAVSMLQGPANLLRKFITRNPVYAARVLMKDSIDSWVRTGADVNPITGALGNVKAAFSKQDKTIRELQAQGITGGHVFNGTLDDMRKIALQIGRGQSGWESLWAKADRMAMMADEAARKNLYDGFIKKGLSPMRASLATLEAQNFTKHGYSPSMRMLSTMIPFFNAQLSGLNNFVRSLAGKSLFEKDLDVRSTMIKRGAMLAGVSMAYTALMQSNDFYKNATDDQKLGYFFIPLPGIEEPLRVGIPFESGVAFKAVPEAIFNLAATDAKAKDVLPALRDQMLNNIPGYSSRFMPQGVKPLIEAYTNTDFFSGNKIESTRQLAMAPEFRKGSQTTEAAQLLGKVLGASPVQIDHMINGYTGGTGLAIISMVNGLLSNTNGVETPMSKKPIIGAAFQPLDGSGLINKAFDDMTQIQQTSGAFKSLIEEGKLSEAEAYMNKHANQIAVESEAGKFRKEMGDFATLERQVRADKKMSPAEKGATIKQIQQMRIETAKQFMSISRE